MFRSCTRTEMRLTELLFSWSSFLLSLKQAYQSFSCSGDYSDCVHFLIHSGHTITSANSFGTPGWVSSSPRCLDKYIEFCWWVPNQLLINCQLPKLSKTVAVHAGRDLEASFSILWFCSNNLWAYISPELPFAAGIACRSPPCFPLPSWPNSAAAGLWPSWC